MVAVYSITSLTVLYFQLLIISLYIELSVRVYVTS